ncbi:MAG: hypothetical protein ABJA89_16015 [Lapillicoccus sp.]
MAIEWVPRSPARERAWRVAEGSPLAAVPEGVEVEGTRAVRVPVKGIVPQRRQRSGLGGWVGLVLLVNVGHLLTAARSASVTLWAALTASWWVLAVVLALALVLAYRFLRLRPLTGRDQPDLALSALGIHTGGLVVPWTSVDRVVRVGFAAGPGRGGPGARRFLAVRVDDFVNVRGLTPFRAGLANLTRRHLVVLCESREIRDPTALSLALEELVANPVARELLSGHEGIRLVTVGPPPGPLANAA